MADLYEVLGVTRDATLDQIKTAYRRLALRHHPDKGGDAELFKKVSNAYQILSNPELRERYDHSGGVPIPEDNLLSPLEIFQRHFNAWLHNEYPLIEALVGHDLIKNIDKYRNHPLVKKFLGNVLGSGVETNDLVALWRIYTKVIDIYSKSR
jgi:curved DNA-binding protein CbpA